MYGMLNWSESLKQLTIKRCSDPKCELVFLYSWHEKSKVFEKVFQR